MSSSVVSGEKITELFLDYSGRELKNTPKPQGPQRAWIKIFTVGLWCHEMVPAKFFLRFGSVFHIFLMQGLQKCARKLKTHDSFMRADLNKAKKCCQGWPDWLSNLAGSSKRDFNFFHIFSILVSNRYDNIVKCWKNYF